MKKKCFIIMPFATTFDGLWKSVIKPTVESISHTCLRADDIFSPGSIIEEIIQSIHDADYIIADITEKNPNVYYELGYAQALEKPVILLSQITDNLPFDLRHQRVIKYSDTIGGAAKLRVDLIKFLEEI